jgi:branched-chain amino acid transport system permease protein
VHALAQILLNGLIVGGAYALVAIGYSLAYGVMNLVNFAHGSVVTAGAFTTLVLVEHFGASLIVTSLVVLLLGGLLGIVIERAAYRPVAGRERTIPLITALGVAIVIENAVAGLFGSDSRSLPASALSRLILTGPFGIRLTGAQCLALVLAGILLFGLWLFVMRTSLGRAMRAVAADREIAGASGIRVNRVVSIAFGIGSSLGAVAGLTLALDVGCDPYMGTVIGFKAFLACVVGGIRNLGGAALGGLALGLAENLIAGYISTEYAGALVMIVLTFLLVLRPQGLIVNSEDELREA